MTALTTDSAVDALAAAMRTADQRHAALLATGSEAELREAYLLCLRAEQAFYTAFDTTGDRAHVCALGFEIADLAHADRERS